MDHEIVPAEEASPEPSAKRHSRHHYRNAKEALSAFSECSNALGDFIDTLSSSHEELSREVEALREREQRLADDLSKFRSLDEQFEKQKLVVAEAERRRMVQDDLLRTSQDEIATKTEALDRVRTEYKEALEKLSAASTELESTRINLSDAERKRLHFEELSNETQRELRDRKKELTELGATLLEQTASLNELEAKLHDVELALDGNNQEMATQAQELKETKWDLLQQREELRVTRGELARKISLLEQREKEVSERTEATRLLNDTVAEQKSELARQVRRIAEQDEALVRANEKLTEQAQTVLRLDRELAKAQDEAEQKRRILRQTEEKRRLDEAERIALEQDLNVTRETLKKKLAHLEFLEKQADAMNRRLGSENQKRREAEELRDRARADTQTLREELEGLSDRLADAELKARTAQEDAARTLKDLEALQHEHRNLLRVEVRQSNELEQLSEELAKKNELYRESQTRSATLREQLDLSVLKLEQQSMLVVNLQQKLAKEQDELQTHKRQLQRATRLPALEAELEDLKRELSSRNLRMEQQEQLIRILQTRLSEKRVVALNPRADHTQGPSRGVEAPEPSAARSGPLTIAQKPKPASGTVGS